MQLTRWQRLRTRAFLFAIGLKRRMTLGARCVLIDRSRVFLIRHTYFPGWHFPGGGVEPGEAASDAVAREVFEETGLRPVGALELLGLYHNSEISDRDHVAVYLCRRFETVRPFAPSMEIAEGGWFAHDALPDQTSPGTARRISEIFAGAERTERW
jgi:8-oxo-dGTP pyrophosphatase MutT (NUDIX family)